MNTEQTKSAALVASLLVNVAFGLTVIWMGAHMRQTILDVQAEAAEARARIQEQVLAGLEEGSPASIESLKQTLRFNIEVEKRLSYKVRTQETSR